MKTIHKFQILLGLFCPAVACAQATAPQIPLGELSVNRNLLLLGTSPSLSWHANYPQPVIQVITVNPDHSVLTNQKVQMTVRVLGVDFRSGTLNLPGRLEMRLNNGSWSQRFLGSSRDVRPNNPVYSGVLNANTRVDFRFMGASDKGKSNPQTTKSADWLWNYPAVTTTTTGQNKIALRDGDVTPSYAPAFAQGSIAGFLSTVISTETQTARIGPRDVLYLTELSTASPNTSSFDMQDMVLLVNFTEAP